MHDPGKVLLDVALTVALGGDCLADVGMLRAEPAVFGPVASDPTVSRLIDTLASGGDRALTAIRTARAEVREHVRTSAGQAAPDADGQVTVDLDGVLVIAHSERQDAGARPRPGRRPSDTTRRWGSSTTAGAGPANPWPVCCGRATRGTTPRQITSKRPDSP